MSASLTAMSFTLELDREPTEEIMGTICPGGYRLNDKPFDFSNVGFTPLENNKLRCEAYNFDTEFFKDAAEEEGRHYKALTPSDVKNGTFSEFFVFNGYNENDEGYTDVLSVSDLEFSFEDGRFLKLKDDSALTRSANDSLALEVTKEEERDL